MDLSRTVESSWTGDDRQDSAEAGAPIPGLILIFSAGKPLSVVLPLQDGPLTLGRGVAVGSSTLDDGQMSRNHAEVEIEGGRWTVRDLDSRNGTAVDGEVLKGSRAFDAPTVLRTGASLFLFTNDTRRFQEGVVTIGKTVLGPALVRVWDRIQRAAQTGDVLHITGETGTGKELAARAFHEKGRRRRGPFVPISGPNITDSLADSVLFGTRKGAFTDAVKTEGYVLSANGGTLFIDEVGDLSLTVQAKLLRVLETKEVTAIGAPSPTPVNISLCTATHKNLRDEVAQGRMREDFFFRVSTPEVRLLPLRERLEAIPYLLEQALSSMSGKHSPRASEPGPPPATPVPRVAHVSLVEACLLRRWPGNVRELLHAVRTAAQEALFEGATAVRSKHLPREAGLAFMPPRATEPPVIASPKSPVTPAKALRVPTDPPKSALTLPPQRRAVTGSTPTDNEIAAAMQKANFNVSAAAVDLSMHRTQLRRRLKVDPLKALIEHAKAKHTDDDTSDPTGVGADE